jgi:hypothetical protein
LLCVSGVPGEEVADAILLNDYDTWCMPVLERSSRPGTGQVLNIVEGADLFRLESRVWERTILASVWQVAIGDPAQLRANGKL